MPKSFLVVTPPITVRFISSEHNNVQIPEANMPAVPRVAESIHVPTVGHFRSDITPAGQFPFPPRTSPDTNLKTGTNPYS